MSPCAFDRDIIMAQESFKHGVICFKDFSQIKSKLLHIIVKQSVRLHQLQCLNHIRRPRLLMYKNGSKLIFNSLSCFGRPMDDFCKCLSLSAFYASLKSLNKRFIIIVRLLRGREEIKKIISLLNKCKII